MFDSLLATLGHSLLLAQGIRQLPPLLKVKVYTALLFLLVVLLFLIVFNRLMARWARRSAASSSAPRPPSYDPDQDDWTRRPLIEEPSDDDQP